MLPDDLIRRLLATRHVGDGIFYARQVMYATIDLDYHTSGEKVDTTAIWDRRRKALTLSVVEGSQPQATFGHLMGGYDSGYYGYLWSKVYAEDMFTVFERYGLTSRKAGMRYRLWILARGNDADPDVLLRGFLGRKPSPEAFYRSIGLGR
jgi:thimet oligopeptidase